MGEWKHTACMICSVTCGLEVKVEDNKIVEVRGDVSNPRTKGHCCRKGRNISYYQHNKDRLTHPLKRVGENEYIEISWEQAVKEICAKTKKIRDTYGPRAIAGHNLGHFSGYMQGMILKPFIAMLGSQYTYSNLGAELTGVYWSFGNIFGREDYILEPDCDTGQNEVFIASGWNGYVSHNLSNAKRVFSEAARDPNRVLVVIDPRKTESARLADIHLRIRPGADALLWETIAAIIIREKWYSQETIDKYIADFDQILPWFENIDIREACEVCDLNYEDVYNLAHLIATKRTGIHSDLGVICGRQSTLTTHIQHVVMAITGNIFRPGTNVAVPGLAMKPNHNGFHNPDNWKTLKTGIPGIMGAWPTAVFAEEVMNDDPQRIRVLFSGNSNPARSYVDTKKVEEAFRNLDLLVMTDMQFTETALFAHYILPVCSAYETYECYVRRSFPEMFIQLRHPVVKPMGEAKYIGDVYLMFMEEMGMIPEIPKELYEAAQRSRIEYCDALFKLLGEKPAMKKLIPVIAAKTLGPVLGSTAKAILWATLTFAQEVNKAAFERQGYPRGRYQGEQIFQDILQHPEGIVAGVLDYEDLFKYMNTPDGKFHLYAEEINEWALEVTAESERQALDRPEYPLVLSAGRHFDYSFNVTFKDPNFNHGRPSAEVLSISEEDAEALGIQDDEMIKLITRRGEAVVKARIASDMKQGHVMYPIGIGLMYQGQVPGLNINELTDAENRDRLVGTPFHRHEPCRIEKIPKEVQPA